MRPFVIPSDLSPRYAVLVAGHTTAELEAEYGDFGDMTIKLLRGNDSEKWTKFFVCDGAFPEEQELTSFQASTSSCRYSKPVLGIVSIYHGHHTQP